MRESIKDKYIAQLHLLLTILQYKVLAAKGLLPFYLLLFYSLPFYLLPFYSLPFYSCLSIHSLLFESGIENCFVGTKLEAKV